MSTDVPSVGVVGAGLVGCLAALALKTKGYDVTLFELREDPQHSKIRNLKSINLAVSDRGIRALKKVDPAIAERVLDQVIPMYGRMIHDKSGTRQESQVYGLFGESINSIDRSYLNQILIDELKAKDVTVHFKHKLIKIDNNEEIPELTLLNTETFATEKYEFDYIVGADGAHSQFRYQLQRNNRMDYSQTYIDMQYLELYIPPGPNGEFAIDANHLHIWPRNNFMLIALPNKDGSFTSTFFSPWSVIESLKTAGEFVDFFRTHFPDAVDLLGEKHLADSFNNAPRGSLMQVSAYPYHSTDGRALIIGDAAHSMVPFYGQGMNCGFEDVSVLLELLDKNHGDLKSTFTQYSDARKKDVDTICRLAWENYFEMSSKVTQKSYLLRKKLDYYLGKYANGRFFQWIPMYTMISFRGDIPYSKAVEIEKKQVLFVQRLQTGIFVAAVVAGAAALWHRWSHR